MSTALFGGFCIAMHPSRDILPYSHEYHPFGKRQNGSSEQAFDHHARREGFSKDKSHWRKRQACAKKEDESPK